MDFSTRHTNALRRTATAWDIRPAYTSPVSYPAACRRLSPIDYGQCEIIEELYREIFEAEDRGALQPKLPRSRPALLFPEAVPPQGSKS